MLLGERGVGVGRRRRKEGREGNRRVARRRIVRWCRRVLRVERVRKKRYWRIIGRVVICRGRGGVP